MNKLFNVSIAFFVAVNLLSAQSNNFQRCGNGVVSEALRSEDPQAFERRAYFEEQTQKWIEEYKSGTHKTDATFKIPVVIHIIYNTSEQNISDAQASSEIAALNRDYNMQNSDISKIPAEFKGLEANIGIEFCLANIDPNGNPTTGITRTQTSRTVWNFTSLNNDPLKKTSQGGKTGWPSTKYLNIWVANLNGILGYAPRPGDLSVASGADGVVIHYQGFGTTGNIWSTYNMGRTAVHEIGHWLNLEHPWGATSSCSSSDFVNDTPPQADYYPLCPNIPSNSCGSNDMTMNFMQWVDDRCMYMFTAGQKARMLAALQHVNRSPLNSSNGCDGTPSSEIGVLSINSPIGTVDCSKEIVPKVRVRNYGLTQVTSIDIKYKVDNDPEKTFNWTGTLNTGSLKLLDLPSTLFPSGVHDFTVTLTNPNGGIDSDPSNDSKTISYTGNCTQIGLDDNLLSQHIDVYPNPSTGRYTINLNGHIGNSYSVVNVLGETVMESGQISDQSIQLDLSNQKDGVYFLRLLSSTGTAIKRLYLLR